jgi:nucleoside-diphosphate kinase
LALVKPDAYNHIGTILSAVQAAGFVIARLRMVRLSQQQAVAFSRMQPGHGQEHAQHLTADVCVAMELVGDDAVGKWLAIVGPEDPNKAKMQAPKSLRAHIATDYVKNGIHGSSDHSAAAAEIDFFFGRGGGEWPSTAMFNNCSLCVVRPHAFHAAGEIVSRILAEGFEISAMGLWHMDRAISEEFLEVYKGVLPEYHDMCSQLCTGPSLVMEVRQEDAVPRLRELMGPLDPEVAKHLRPGTIRAKHGVDRVQNGVHCTDLTEDGLLEVEYFFNILYNRGGC